MSTDPDSGIVTFPRNDVEPRLDEPLPEQSIFNIAGYLDSLVRLIGDDIRIPQDSKALRKRIFVLRIHCEHSPPNTSLLHSVNGFDRLMGALCRYFNVIGIRNWHGIEEREQTLKLCREIVKLVDILGFGPDRPCHSEILCGIMRMVYFEGRDESDKGRIVRILHSMLYDARMRFFDAYYYFIKLHLENPISPSSELSLCADITSRLLVRRYNDPTFTSLPLSQALRTIVSRVYELCRFSDSFNEEFAEECAVLEKVMKLLCRVCVHYAPISVSFLGLYEFVVMQQVTKILKHVLWHQRPGGKSFNGKHLLYAVLLAKNIYDRSRCEYSAAPEDVKVVLDFALSNLPNHYLFNGRRRLKDLVDQMVPSVLNSFHANYVLNNWNRITVHLNT